MLCSSGPIKEVWTYGDNRIAVRFVYESHDAEGQWFGSHGNENWEFDEHDLPARQAAVSLSGGERGREHARRPGGRAPRP